MASPAPSPARHDERFITVRGFVVQRPDGQWYAHCIDLTIDALAPTRDQALEKMSSATLAYLTWATERGVPLMRPSPLRFRLRYYALALQDRFRGLVPRPPQPESRSARTFHRPIAA